MGFQDELPMGFHDRQNDMATIGRDGCRFFVKYFGYRTYSYDNTCDA